MARKPRLEYPGALLHVIVRGNNRQEIFHDDEDRRAYLERLGLYLGEARVTIYCFCLMPNHVHLLVEVGECPLSQVLHRLLTWHARYHSVKYKRVGHLFQGRYKAILCDKDAYLLELVRYIHLNPVRAGVVTDPREYWWSSHRAYLGEVRYPRLNTEFVLSQFAPGRGKAQRLYEDFVLAQLQEGPREDLYDLREQRILGDDTFAARVYEMSKAAVPGPIRLSVDLRSLQAIVEGKLKLAPQAMLAAQRPGVQARRLFCYLAREHGGFKNKDVAVYLGRDMATVTQGVRLTARAIRESSDVRQTVEGLLVAMQRGRPTYQSLVTRLRNFFREERGVILAYLFGSAAREKRGSISDIDIGVLYPVAVPWDRHFELAHQIQTLLGGDEIDLIALNRAPAELAYTCIDEGILLYAEKEAARVEFELKILNAYGDLLPMLERQRRETLESDHETGNRRYYEAFREIERMLGQAGALAKKKPRRVRPAALSPRHRRTEPRGRDPVSDRHGKQDHLH
jgi:putative transposase